VPDGKEADREAGHHPRSQADINRQRNASQQRQAALVEEIPRAGAMNGIRATPFDASEYLDSPEAIKAYIAERDAVEMRLRTALDALYVWYELDGSVGGACDVFEKYRDTK
jgi:hypothetical protein